MAAHYYYNLIENQETHNKHFIKGNFYKSKLQNIIACYSGNPEKNSGYWSTSENPDNNIRMITPEEWEPIDKPDNT